MSGSAALRFANLRSLCQARATSAAPLNYNNLGGRLRQLSLEALLLVGAFVESMPDFFIFFIF